MKPITLMEIIARGDVLVEKLYAVEHGDDEIKQHLKDEFLALAAQAAEAGHPFHAGLIEAIHSF